MRKYIRDMIVELIPTILEGARTAKKSQPKAAAVLIDDCFCALDSIDEVLSSALSEERYNYYKKLLDDVKISIERLKIDISAEKPASQVSYEIRTRLETLRKELLGEPEVRLEVVFMPYKASMWDALESIWRAACEDPRCDAHVVPIPYYDRNKDRSLGKYHYEGGEFPDDVPITDYRVYDLSICRPDVIYIHNPYDGINYVTSVDPMFYSTELKKYTDMLVYVPYYIAGGYRTEEAAAQKFMAPGVLNADKIIVQNKVMEQFVNRLHPGKAVNAGSPKTDFAVLKTRADINIPEEWEDKISDNKVILLNFSLASILGYDEWINRYPDIIDILSDNENITVIWRPHPLMEATLESMRPHLIDKYRKLKNTALLKQNIIVDETADFDRAIIISDALITDFSSLIYKFMATKKPLMLFTASYTSRHKKQTVDFFDYSSSYFWYMEDHIFERANRADDGYMNFRKSCSLKTGTERRDISLREFVKIILTGNDYLREQRISALNKYAPDIGNCGKKINDIINKAVMKK